MKLTNSRRPSAASFFFGVDMKAEQQDEYLQSLMAKMDVTDYVDIPESVTTADEFWEWLQTVNSSQEETRCKN